MRKEVGCKVKPQLRNRKVRSHKKQKHVCLCLFACIDAGLDFAFEIPIVVSVSLLLD